MTRCDFCHEVPRLGVDPPIIYHEGAPGQSNSFHCDTHRCAAKCPECLDLIEAVTECAPTGAVIAGPALPLKKIPHRYWNSYVTDQEVVEAEIATKEMERRLREFNNLQPGYYTASGFIGEMKTVKYLEESGLVNAADGEFLWELLRPGNSDGGIDIRGRGITIDVKTLNNQFRPKQFYKVNVNEDQKNRRRADAYLFATYHLAEQRIFLVGWIPGDEFDRKAVRREKGERLQEGKEVNAPMWDIRIDQLYPMEDVLPLIGRAGQ